ncbi:MAG TPA: hypothetical protein VEL74_17840 [Thermoanaerobaculia bacterium]|nr:hypothetical protein [Thermoanaerobaculia bacterium]
MELSSRLREIEHEIDSKIRGLEVWQAPRAEVLEHLVYTYRDLIEEAFMRLLHARTFGLPPDEAFYLENRGRNGMLWALKWASEYCPESGKAHLRSPDDLMELVRLGGVYEVFVDALKYAGRGLVTIHVEESSKIITCYEGSPATAFDASIVDRERIVSPQMPHVSLTEDGDRITTRWTAGDYRKITKELAQYGASEENAIVVDPEFALAAGMSNLSVPQPTVVWVNRPADAPGCHVFDDLVLPVVMDSKVKWQLVSLLENPVIKVGERYCALSSDLRAISEIDDYMLRLAARVDQRQYSLASVRREERMLAICRRALEQASPPWAVEEQVRYKKPTQEADILAKRGADKIAIELKSTLRPETPWEVFKRNQDLVKGVKQVKRLIDRSVAERGFLVTDGYRGDYVCWAEALANEVPIGNLYDLDIIAEDPSGALRRLKDLVGIPTADIRIPEGLPDREENLFEWTLRLVDRKSPDHPG